MSSLWLARRCAHVTTVDHDRGWAERVRELASHRGLSNIEVHWILDQTQYANPPGCELGSFDLVIVDGIARPECATASLELVKPNGSVYIDNTDFGSQWQWYVDAEDILLRAAKQRNGRIRYFTGFPPATLVPTQGMLLTFG
jgi:predicted O-methyltransferase YrrM